MKNVGGTDRVIRFIFGFCLLSLLFIIDGDWKYIGFIGVVPLFTALSASCMINRMLGRNTCRVSTK